MNQVNFLYRIMLYVFPLFLLFFEWIIRVAANNEEQNAFWVPSLATAGIGLLLPLLVAEGDVTRLRAPKWKGVVNRNMPALALIALFVGMALWCLILLGGLKNQMMLPEIPGTGFDAAQSWAVLYYFLVCLGFSEAKSGAMQ
jgi:hypothetical protein